MDPFTQQSQQVHPPHEVRSPHQWLLTAEQVETIQRWLDETADPESLSIREIADFVSRHPPMADVLNRTLTSVSVGHRIRSPSVHHAVAMLGSHRSLDLLRQLAQRSRRQATKPG